MVKKWVKDKKSWVEYRYRFNKPKELETAKQYDEFDGIIGGVVLKK